MAEELTREEQLVVLAYGRGAGAQLSEDDLVKRSTLDRSDAIAAAESLRGRGLMVQIGTFWRLTERGADVFGGLTKP